LVILLAIPLAGQAQEIEPRTFVNTPVDLNLLAVGYLYQTGNVFFDPSLPIEDVEADIHGAMVRYVRTLGLGGKPAKLTVLFPLISGDWEGFLEGEFRTRDASGMGDLRFAVDVLLWGARARSLGDVPDPSEKTIVGAGIAVVLPTGTYDNQRLVNLGLNRWAFRPQIGISHNFGKLMLEAIGGVALYGENDDFYGGQRLTQDPLWLLKADAVYTFRPGLWVGFGLGYGTGASTRVNGVVSNTLQTNWRFGGTLAYAVAPQHGISVTVLSGVTTRIGADFNSLGFAYQYLW
jgi:hypothetical protein